MSALSIEDFGNMVRARRAQKGWTQGTLAHEALGNADRKGYISQLETGKLPNITALTLQNVARALEIPQVEIASLLGVTAPDKNEVTDELEQLRLERGSLQDALDNVSQLTRAYLIALATQFELPDAYTLSDAALRDFLTKRAEEYRAYRMQIDALDVRIAGLGNLKAAAQDAAAQLDFDEVDALLSRVHEVETDIAAKTAEARAANALLRGQVQHAFNLLSAAADSYGAVDTLAPARKRVDYMQMLCDHGINNGGLGLAMSAQMARDVLKVLPQSSDPRLWGAAQNNLAISLKEQGIRTGGAAGAAFLGQSAEAYQAALEVLTPADHSEEWAGAKSNLAVVLTHQARHIAGAAGVALLDRAAMECRAALEVLKRSESPLFWVAAMQTLSGALKDIGVRTEGTARASFLGQAVAINRLLVEGIDRAAFPLQWAAAMQNFGVTLEVQGAHTEGASGVILLEQSYQRSLVLTRLGFPNR
jgi:transcriptional regulator with XRE-family HTH domain